MDAPFAISVVIPCFNAQSYIAGALRSVLAQEWSDLEILVIDDGSTDRSVELVRDAFPQVRLLQQDRRGAAAARNLGIEQARGEWIAFLDADDIWLPGKLAAQYRMLRAAPEARMGYGAWKVWVSNAPEPDTAFIAELLGQAHETQRWVGPSGWIYPQLLLDCEVWTTNVLAHRSLFAEIGLFDTTLPIGEDYDLWLRASRVTPILRVPRPLALYRAHSGSLTNGVARTNYRSLVVLRAIERWGYGSPDGAQARRRDVRRALAHSWSNHAGSHLDAGHIACALHGSLMALRNAPEHAGGWKVLVKALARSLSAGPRPARA